MESKSLPPATQALWKKLSLEPALAGFVLIGGTALSLRIAHRISEDLDFAFLGQTLPRKRIEHLLKDLQRISIHARIRVDVAAQDDFIDAGLDLNDFQQNYLFETPEGAVKVSFIAFESRIRQCFKSDASHHVRVADLDEIFRTKVICACDRNKTRDWFDLYVLMNHHGYQPMDIFSALQAAGSESMLNILNQRLRKLVPSAADEGYTHLAENPPPLDAMQDFFNERLDELEIELAARAFARKNK